MFWIFRWWMECNWVPKVWWVLWLSDISHNGLIFNQWLGQHKNCFTSIELFFSHLKLCVFLFCFSQSPYIASANHNIIINSFIELITTSLHSKVCGRQTFFVFVFQFAVLVIHFSSPSAYVHKDWTFNCFKWNIYSIATSLS